MARKKHPVLARLIGVKLREARQRKGMTQVEVARKRWVVGSNISLIESGRSTLNLSTLLSLCDIYDIELSDIVSLSEYREITRRGLQ